MVRETPVEEPSAGAAASAVEAALGVAVESVVPMDAGVNALYRVDLADGRSAVLKVATVATDAELLPEPHIQDRLDRETTVPVPEVLAVLGPDEGSLPAAAFLAAYREGRRVEDVLALSPPARERLVSESGRHLAAIHGLRGPDGFGRLAVERGSLVVPSPADSWADRFGAVADDALDGLAGAGFLADDDGRFADLAPAIRAALGGFRDLEVDRTVAPAVLHGDYRPANLVLAPDDGATPLVRGVLDVGVPATGDGLLDCALAEGALVDVPLGGTDPADVLRDAFRGAYAAGRGRPRDRPFDARYPYYRLLARTWRLGSFGYWHRFAREDDPDAVAERWRGFVRARLRELD